MISIYHCNFFSGKKWVDTLIVYALVDRLPENITYSTTFPNHYQFTRLVSYDRQIDLVDNKELISFDFPLKKDSKTSINNVFEIEKLLKDNNIKFYGIFTEYQKYVYPISGQNIDNELDYIASLNNVYSIGRQGLFCYVSMANAWEKADLLADKILNNELDTKEKRLQFYKQVRADLW
jgi:hypothetical protein